MNKLAAISLSGGIDSTSLLLHLAKRKYKIFALGINYGQKHNLEIKKSSKNISYLKSKGLDITHEIIDLTDCSNLLSSSLTNKNKNVPEGFYEEKNMISTVVPNRNSIFISILYGWALSISKNYNKEITISLGVHSGDHAIYPDCRIEFYEKIMESFKIGNWDSDKISLYLPYINFNKKEILKDALTSTDFLNLDFNSIFKNTITSYAPDENGISNGKTGSDIERILAFDKLGLEDPIEYQNEWADVLSFAKKTELNFKKKNQ